MVTITTDKGYSYNAICAYAPTYNGNCVVQLNDWRSLSDIAAEFDGLNNIHLSDPVTGDLDFNGYSRLVSIFVDNAYVVTIQMSKPITNGAV